MDIFAATSIGMSYKSDHSPICLKLYISKSSRGMGVWKLNNSLLIDNELVNIITKEIELTVATYACTPYSPDFVKNFRVNDIEYLIEIELLWNVLFSQLRGLIIEYASKKKKKTYKLFWKKAEREEHLKANDVEWNNWVGGWREELEEIREEKLRGSLIRSRVQCVDLN